MTNAEVQAEGMDSNVVHIQDYIDESTGEKGSGSFGLPADGWQDKTSMDWTLSAKEPSADETTADFNNLMM